MRDFTTPSDLANTLLTARAQRIGIDGAEGSGKSTLAKEIAKVTGLIHIEVDDFLERGQDSYVDSLRQAELQDALSVEGFVVEGVCLLQALQGLSLDALVYVMPMRHGSWTDDWVLDVKGPVDQHLAQIENELRPLADAGAELLPPGLAREIIIYHGLFRPHEVATHLYLRAV